MRYHTKSDGEYGECQADQGRCPFGKTGALHFDNKKDAAQHSEKILSEKYGKTSTLKKNTVSSYTKETIAKFLDESEKFIKAEENGRKLTKFIESFRTLKEGKDYSEYSFDKNFVKELDADRYDVQQIFEAFVDERYGEEYSSILDFETNLDKGTIFISYEKVVLFE